MFSNFFFNQIGYYVCFKDVPGRVPVFERLYNLSGNFLANIPVMREGLFVLYCPWGLTLDNQLQKEFIVPAKGIFAKN